MDTNLIWIFGGAALLAVFGLALALFFISRKSQSVMNSLLQLLLQPERVKIADAARVVKTVMNDEVKIIEDSFKIMSHTLEQHILRAAQLEKQLGERNGELVAMADTAVHSIMGQTENLHDQLRGFIRVTESQQWNDVSESATNFQALVDGLLININDSVQDASEKSKILQKNIDDWIKSGKILSNDLQSDMENNRGHMNSIVVESTAMRESLGALNSGVQNGFIAIKNESAGYEKIMTANEKLLSRQLEKMDIFTKQSKTLLVSQVNGLTGTANVVGGQIRLAESSIEKQGRVLGEAITKLMEAAETTESFVRNISGEVAILAGKFHGEIREFATGVVGELNTVHSVANTTLANTKAAAGSFSESVRTMADGVRETISEMNAAHSMLTEQSGQLVKISNETTQNLKPLSELIEQYYSALPELSRDSNEMTERMVQNITSLDDKLRSMNDTARESLVGMADSSLKLEHMSGQSRQQMIDLLSDYAKAVDTMQTLNRQMVEARASAPMVAISTVPTAAHQSAFNVTPQITTNEFIKQSEKLIEKMHELSVDLTRSVGAEIPDSIWNKYQDGDKTIFSKWFAKMLSAADKKRVRAVFKQDAVFRSQATQFVRGFAKMLAGAEHTDNREMLTASLLKTDLGQMYMVLKSFM